MIYKDLLELSAQFHANVSRFFDAFAACLEAFHNSVSGATLARSTDTRQRVREVADQLLSQGTEPTVGLVRGVLGRGSPNTIVEELRKWRDARGVDAVLPLRPAGQASPALTPAQNSSPFVAPAPVGLSEVLHALQVARELLDRQTSSIQKVEGLKQSLLGVSSVLRQNLEQTALLMASLESDRKMMVESLQAMQARYDGTQKHMLLSIEQAREEARLWKERARVAQEETTTWRMTIQQRIEMLLGEKGVLQGRLDAANAELARTRLGTVVSATAGSVLDEPTGSPRPEFRAGTPDSGSDDYE